LVLHSLEEFGHAEPAFGEELVHVVVFGVMEMGHNGAEFLAFDQVMEEFGVGLGTSGEAAFGGDGHFGFFLML